MRNLLAIRVGSCGGLFESPRFRIDLRDVTGVKQRKDKEIRL